MLVQRSPGRSGDTPSSGRLAAPSMVVATRRRPSTPARPGRARARQQRDQVSRTAAGTSLYRHAAAVRDTWPRRLAQRGVRGVREAHFSGARRGAQAETAGVESPEGRGVAAADACSFSEVPAAAAIPRPPGDSRRHPWWSQLGGAPALPRGLDVGVPDSSVTRYPALQPVTTRRGTDVGRATSSLRVRTRTGACTSPPRLGRPRPGPR